MNQGLSRRLDNGGAAGKYKRRLGISLVTDAEACSWKEERMVVTWSTSLTTALGESNLQKQQNHKDFMFRV